MIRVSFLIMRSALIPIQSSVLFPLQALESSPSSQQLGREDELGGPHVLG